MKKQNFFLVVLLFLGNMILYAQCSVNAGGNATICGTSYTLQGSSSGSTSGTPTWTLVSKPSGAPDPVISNVNALTPNVTGMTSPGNYVFQVAQNCSPTGTATSQVTITAPGDVSTFTAGPDITNVNATTGTVTLNGVVPNGYTASWSAYNIYRWERSAIKNAQNSQFSSTTSGITTFSLIKKADHDIDPAYVVTLRITSTNNPNCWYEDTAIVRFIPNPQILPTLVTSRCVSSTGNNYISLQSTSPKFSKGYSSSPGSSGNFGTTVTMNVTSQPAGGNIAYSNIFDDFIFFTGLDVIGVYKFTLTVTNSSGTYTTSEITYTYNGIQPNPVNFLVASRPEQMMIYQSAGSGGEVHCGYAGLSTPITFYYTIDPTDNPATINTNVASSGTNPPGGAPVVVNGGAGTATRSATVTPPSGGWSIGTYRFTITRDNAGACSATQSYYIHISDGSRSNVTVPTTTVCYPGSGVVTATVPLPAVYKGVVNTSYFQDFDGRYRLTLVSKPVGAANPVFEPYASTLFTNTSTTISNLNLQGEYIFKIKADIPNTSVGTFLDQEYNCSGASLEGTFSVFVSAQVGANAGSTQTLIGTSQTTFNANNPGVATGAWTLLTKPSGATDPVIATPSSNNTNVTGFNTPGTYTFRWTVTTGTCSSTSDLTVNVLTAAPGGVDGAQFWIKSDDAGTIATAWKDHSINANDIPAVGTWSLSAADKSHNFNPYTTGYSSSKLFYNSTSVLNSTNGELANTNTSIFSAVRPTTATGTGRITGIDDDATYASEPGVSIASGDPRQYEYFNTTTSTDFSTAFTNGISNIFSAIANNAVANGGTSTFSGGEKRLGLNGTYETTTFTGSNKFQIYGRNLRVGHAGWDASGAFPGDIMEVIWYKRTLNADEQSRVNSYLAVKNGVTLNENYLSTGSSIVWDRTINTGYNNNIFGIARDNLTVLHQKQSGSINSGQKLVISTTGFADNNITNATGLANDLQFLMTGDNGLKQELSTLISYTGSTNGEVNSRFASVWKTQNTGSVGTVTVAWPKGVKNLYLVQSSDAVFDGTDTFTPMVTEITVNGVVYNTANVTLGNGQFFTFAGYTYAPGGVFSAAWYRADAANTLFSDAGATNATDASTVQQWNEFNNKPFPLSQATANLRPEFSNATTLVNFNATVNYTTANKWLQYDGNTLGNIIDRSTGTLFSAGSTTGTTAFFGFGVSGASNTMDDPGLYNFTGNKFLFYPIIGEYDPVSTYTINGPYIGGGTWQNGAGVGGNNAVDITLNGFHQTYNTGISNVNIAATRNALMAGGAETSVAFQQNEMIVFSTKLADVEVNKVESYLAIKYGHTLSKEQNRNYLSSSGTMVWDGSASDYYNNVFGIARDNISALYQKQSRSINNGQQLIIGAGNSLAETNAANANSLVEGQFLITGDNGLKQSLTTPLTYTTGANGVANFRFESIWKAQNTGNVGTVTVAWPKGVKNLYLVQSSDAVFDGTDTFTPMITEVTVNGVVYNTANVALGNGQFFTFAGFAQAPGGVVGPDFWVKSDDTGTIGTAWKDHSINADDIPNVGGMTLSLADRSHNFYPYTTGYTTSKFFYNAASVMNPTNGELPNTNTSIFSAVRPTTATGTGRITGIDDDATYASEPGVSIASGDPRQYEYYNTITSTDFSTPFNNGISNIFSAIANNSATNGGTSTFSGGEKILGLNGTYETTTYTNSNKFQIYGQNLRIGHAGWDASGAFPGDIMEVIWYKRTLSAGEQSRVNSYLAVKNGVTLNENYLATNSNVVWDRTTNTGYNNNIFGIAKDDFTALHQKQAGSVNNAQKLVISTTGLADNNAANATGLANDLQFLMTGDNGLFQGLKTPFSYTAGSNGIANYRFESIWKTQNTGGVGTVTVAWPKGVKNLYLVQSSDAVFDGTDTFTPMTTEITVNGVVYNTVSVTLGNGQFFTFAGFGNAPGGVASGLSYWYRADKNAANTGVGTDVTGWTDVWNGTTVAQLGTNALPKYVLGTSNYFNFNSGINFTANTQTLGNNTVRTLTSLNFDVFTLTKEGVASGGATYPRIFSVARDNITTGALNWDGFGIWTSAILERRVYGTDNAPGASIQQSINPVFSTTIPSIMYFQNTDTSSVKGLNGAATGTAGSYTAIGYQYGGHTFGSPQFSSNGSDNIGFIGNIGETIVYGAGTLTTADRRKVDSYLAIKYGITLGQLATAGANNLYDYVNTDGATVWSRTLNTAYNNNVFGIARDDIEIFEQKVSKSVNTGTILTVATINDFVVPNLDASRTGFANDKTYLLLGDNNVTATGLNAITINGIAGQRIQRAWLSQRTNTAGAVYLEADLSTYGTTFTSGNNVRMIVADDAAFTTNVVSVAGTYSGGKWVHNYNFDSGNAGRYITYVMLPLDSDNDGVADSVDLDDDNDGILDTGEMSCLTINAVQPTTTGAVNTFPGTGIPSFTATYRISTVQSAAYTYTSNIFGFTNVTGVAAQTNTGSPINHITFNRPVYNLDLALDDVDGSETATLRFYDTNNNLIPGSIVQPYVVFTGSQISSVTYPSGQSIYVVGGSGTSTTTNSAVRITFPKDLGISRIEYEQVTAINGTSNNGLLLFNGCVDIDSDGDTIWNRLDLDSDNDGCLDAIEGDENVAPAQLVTSVSGLSTGVGSTASNQNLCASGSCVDVQGVPIVVNSGGAADIGGDQGQGVGSSADSTINGCSTNCYKPGVLTGGTIYDTKVGISALGRAGVNADNWPMVRKGGWLALEAKTKGFVLNRVAFSGANPVGIAPANFVEGMLVYDTTNKCMKMYTSQDSGTTFGWYCVSTQTCPD